MNLILDNIIYNLQRVGGISVCWTELIKRIERTSYEREYIEYRGCMDNVLRQNIILRESNKKLGLFDRYLPVKLNKTQSFIFHSSYYRYTTNKLARQVVTVHDFIYERYDTGIRKVIHSYQKNLAIKHADIVVCISESAKNDLFYFYPQFKNKDIRIIYNGVGASFYPLALNTTNELFPELNNRKYILIVGNRVGCKNFDFVANVFTKLNDTFDIVIVGAPLSDKEKAWLNYETNKERIHLYSGVSDEDLNVLYNKAFCLLIPSKYEGFGIPIVEAMRAGCPVVTTTYSSIPEVADDAALYIEELNIDSAVAQIYSLEDEKIREMCTLRGLDNAKRFSWDKNFEEYLSIYNSLT